MASRAQEEQSRRDERTSRTTTSASDHDKTCVFSALTSSHPSIVFKKNKVKRESGTTPSSSSSEPAPRSTYIAVQKGDSDIPLAGLQKPAPQPKAHRGKHFNSMKRKFNFISIIGSLSVLVADNSLKL